MLRVMANFANFFQLVHDYIDQAGDFMGRQAGAMRNIFNPEEEDEGNEDAIRGIGVALGVIGTVIGALSGAPPAAGVLVGVAGAILPIFEREAT
jgi:hypothetical protein